MDSYYTLTFISFIQEGTEITLSGEIPDSLKTMLDTELDVMNVFADGDLEDGVTVYCRWNYWEEDMRLLSTKFPTLLFCLNYYGDDPYDMWEAYFWNGLMQMCPATITFVPFDRNALTPDSFGKALVTKYSYQEG